MGLLILTEIFNEFIAVFQLQNKINRKANKKRRNFLYSMYKF